MVLISDKISVRFIPLYYTTYNKREIVLCILITLCFITFISISTMAMRYELFNKQNYCDPTFYYGNACRNVISKTILSNPRFIKSRKNFYDNVNNIINSKMNSDESDILKANVEMDKNEILTSDEYIDESTKKISDITDVLTQIKTQSLGGFGSALLKPIKSANDAISDKLKDLPNTLNQIKIMLDNGFIKPSTIHLYDALEKLYRATLENGSSSAVKVSGSNLSKIIFGFSTPAISTTDK